MEGEVGAPVGDVHVLDAGGQGGCHGLVNLELLGHGRVQLGLPLGRTASGQGKEEQKAKGEQDAFHTGHSFLMRGKTAFKSQKQNGKRDQ